MAACVALQPARGICQESIRHVEGRAPANLLAQLNDSLERLASKVAPAVVQIEATGFGPAQHEERKTPAIIVRQHGIGAGVIVDADGYIMTNALSKAHSGFA